MSDRKPIPMAVASAVLMANRHACCVCQKVHVQLHHIDEDPANNTPENLAALCLDHHDMASMKIGLTKKLRAPEVKSYKNQWEETCANDVQALARDRMSFYSSAYKNPPRIRELFLRLSEKQRATAARALRQEIAETEPVRSGDKGFDWQMNPRENNLTLACLTCLAQGELWPSCLPRVEGHVRDPDYPTDLSPPNGMIAFHGDTRFSICKEILPKTLYR